MSIGHMHWDTFTLIFCALLIGSSCGGESDDEVEAGVGPLANLMGYGPDSVERALSRQLAINDLIVQCMNGEGYDLDEYEELLTKPDDFLESANRAAESSWAALSLEEFRRTYGLGITTTVLAAEYQRYGLVTGDHSFQDLTVGPDTTADASTATAAPALLIDLRECHGQVMAAAINDYPELEFQERFSQEIFERTDAHPSVVEAYDSLGRCVSRDGYEYGRDTDFELAAEMESIAIETDAFLMEDREPPQDQIEQIRELQAYEKGLAEAIEQCGGFRSIDEAVQTARVEVETELLQSDPSVKELVDRYSDTEL
jgi:hypothetical protein